MDLIAAIPTISNVHSLAALCYELLDDEAVDALLCLDNGHDAGGMAWMDAMAREDNRFHRVSTRGMSIYQQWNHAWEIAYDADPNSYLLMCNDDLRVPDHVASHLAHALEVNPDLWLVCPDYHRRVAKGIEIGAGVKSVKGTYRHGGICGWCWMVPSKIRDTIGPIDTQFEWWFGDDDLAFKIEDHGGTLGILQGLPLDHVNEATASKPEHSWTNEAKGRDIERARAKWGDR